MDEIKLTVGNVEILAIHDNETALPLNMMFPDVPAEAWTPYQQRYPEGFTGADNQRIHFECYVLRSSGFTILVDTGAGSMATNPGTITAFAGGVDGRLLSELQAAGVSPQDVGHCILEPPASGPRGLEPESGKRHTHRDISQGQVRLP